MLCTNGHVCSKCGRITQNSNKSLFKDVEANTSSNSTSVAQGERSLGDSCKAGLK